MTEAPQNEERIAQLMFDIAAEQGGTETWMQSNNAQLKDCYLFAARVAVCTLLGMIHLTSKKG